MTTQPRPLRDLPGPYPWPVFGNIFSLKPTRIHLDLERLSQQYGDVFRIYFGSSPVLVIAKHTTVNAVLRERPHAFRRPSVTERVSKEMGGMPGLFLAEGDAWRLQRRMVMAGFAPHAVKSYFPVLQKVVLRLQARWALAAAQGRCIDLTLDLKSYAVDIIAGLAFGQDVNTLESGENATQMRIDTLLQAVSRRSFSLWPYWRYLRLPQDRRLDHSLAALREEVSGLIVASRTKIQAQPELLEHPSNLLEAMIVAADQPESGMTDEWVAGNVSTLLIAGEDTTAHSMAWLLYLLKQNPSALEKARHEIQQHSPHSAAFSIEQLDSLIYLDACIQEAMRLKPVAPFIPLEATQNTVIDGVAVPARTIVMCLMRSDSMKDAHFESAQQFNPERWLVATPDKKISTPFGSGPRTCPGRYLALLEIKIAFAMLLAHFEITCVSTASGQAAAEHMGFVMSPLGLKMTLTPL